MGSYRTVARTATVELKIEKSRFLGCAAPTADVTAAQEAVAALRQEHRQATHVCFAYRVGDGPSAAAYFTDHGEPAGTAGKPIFGAILRRDLTDVTVIVVRYFGGKKLGVRGLIEAYGETATAVLESAGTVARQRLHPATVVCAYAPRPGGAGVVRGGGGAPPPPLYDATGVRLAVRVPPEAVPALEAALAALPADLLR
jgi:uncharacterized YigZ family protein